MDNDCKQFHDYFLRFLQVLSQVDLQGVLYEFAYLSHAVCETFELKSGDLRDTFQQESLPGIGSHLAELAEVLVGALKLVDCEEAADAIEEGASPLALLTCH